MSDVPAIILKALIESVRIINLLSLVSLLIYFKACRMAMVKLYSCRARSLGKDLIILIVEVQFSQK